MSGLYFLRIPVILFLIGYLLQIAGSLLKIRHWAGGDETITIGAVVSIAAIVFGITKIAFMKNPKL